MLNYKINEHLIKHLCVGNTFYYFDSDKFSLWSDDIVDVRPLLYKHNQKLERSFNTWIDPSPLNIDINIEQQQHIREPSNTFYPYVQYLFKNRDWISLEHTHYLNRLISLQYKLYFTSTLFHPFVRILKKNHIHLSQYFDDCIKNI